MRLSQVVRSGPGQYLCQAAELLNVEYITLPTVLGTCAATTPLSAMYWPDHAFRSVDYYHLRLSDPG